MIPRKIKLLTVVGARPQFIKAAAVSRSIENIYHHEIEEILVHTGQHFDDNMSSVFFESLALQNPHHHLGIAGGLHGAMTGKMLEALERVMLQEKPDWVLVYGDTNSTLAAALAASKLNIKIAHVEAGLRSFNRKMPEEINRLLTDHLATLSFCPTEAAVFNLKQEGIEQGVHLVGDVMYDVALHFQMKAAAESQILKRLGLQSKTFALATCHRAENTDISIKLKNILEALSEIAETLPLIFPLHPRTRAAIDREGFSSLLDNLIVTDPLPYLDMVMLEKNAKVILTDSGGVQKEAFFYETPCVTLREETEWLETVACGFNVLVGDNKAAIIAACFKERPHIKTAMPYGDGSSAEKILAHFLT